MLDWMCCHKQIKLCLCMLRCSVQTVSALSLRLNHIRVSYRIYSISQRETISSPSLTSASFNIQGAKLTKKKRRKTLLIQYMSLANSPLSRNRMSAYNTGCTLTFHAEHALWFAYGFLKTTFCLILSDWSSQFTNVLICLFLVLYTNLWHN